MLSALLSVKAFGNSPNLRRVSVASLSMMWGSNLKVGTTVIIPESPDSISKIPKTSSPNGENDAGSSIYPEGTDGASVISKIDLALKQKALMLALASDKVSETIKLERIQLATERGVLPSSFSSSTVVSASLPAGGLMKDWDFALE